MNKEEAVPALIDRVAENLKQYVVEKLKHLDETLVACLQRRDKKWEEEEFSKELFVLDTRR